MRCSAPVKMKLLAALVIGLAGFQVAPDESELLTPVTRPTTRELPPRNVSELVTILRGDLPLILSAPHGGTLRVPGAEPRTGANVPARRGAKNNFTVATDRNVDQIALRIAGEIERRTGKRPYVVVANFKRTYVDANRPASDAYESEAAGKVYEQYHDALREFRAEILRTWHRGLLVDIHGHSNDPAVLIRGTADWATVTHLVEEFGKGSVVGPDGLLGPIEAAGFKITPANGETLKEEFAALNGGYITRHYGSFAGGNFDAIQWELGNDYRSADGMDRFAPVAAEALVRFWNTYLTEGEGKLKTTLVPADK